MSFWVAGISTAVGAIGSSLISANASENAADAQSDSAKNALEAQMSMFRQNKADLAPWTQAGGQGLNALLGYLGVGPNGFDPNAPGMRPFGMQDFQADPGYQFRLNEGENAILNKRSALGGLQSGNTLRDLTRFGQGLASDEYQNAYNRYNNNIANVYKRLGGLSDTGANSAMGVAGLGASAAGRAGEYMTQMGNAQAAGIMGQGNALAGGLGAGAGLMNNWLLANQMQQQGQRGQVYGDQMDYMNNQALMGG